MIMVFFGPPGSGKGTQAQKLEKNLKNVVHVSTGDLLRQEVASGSPLGLQIKSTIESGSFVTDEVVLELASSALRKNIEKNIIFDGFPRTLNQAIAFDALLGVENNLKIDVVFNFDIDAQTLVGRISGRYVCLDCGAVYHKQDKKPKIDGVCDQCKGNRFAERKDDSALVLETRLAVYQEQTLPVIAYYRNKGLLKQIDASLPLEDVTLSIQKALSEVEIMKEGE